MNLKQIMGYKIVTLEEAEGLDFNTLDQTILETARKNIDGSLVLISADDLEGFSLEEIKLELDNTDWNYG